MKNSKIILLFITSILYLNVYSNIKSSDFVANISYIPCYHATAHFYYTSDLFLVGNTIAIWDFGDGTTITNTFTNIANYLYSNPGFYTVTLTLISNGDTVIITKPDLIKIYHPPIVHFTFTYSDSLMFSPLIIDFTSQALQGDGVILSYLWNFGDNETSNDENPSHVFTNPGTYDVTLNITDNNGCESGQYTQFIIKDTAQRGEINYITTQCSWNDTSSCGYEKHYQLENDTLKIFGYIQENCCGIKTVTIRQRPDTIVIRQFAIGPLCSCLCGFCFSINVPNITQNSIYVIFDGDTVLVSKIITQIINTSKLNNENIYLTNPIINNLQINLHQESEIEIKNIQGQSIRLIKLPSGKSIIDFSNISSGIYFVKIKIDNEFNIYKLIKI